MIFLPQYMWAENNNNNNNNNPGCFAVEMERQVFATDLGQHLVSGGQITVVHQSDVTQIRKSQKTSVVVDEVRLANHSWDDATRFDWQMYDVVAGVDDVND